MSLAIVDVRTVINTQESRSYYIEVSEVAGYEVAVHRKNSKRLPERAWFKTREDALAYADGIDK